MNKNHYSLKNKNWFIFLVLWLVANSAPAIADDNATAPNLSELQINGYYSKAPSSDVEGGSGYGLNTKIYTPIIDNNWRLFAGEYYAHEDEPAAEGVIALWQTSAGVEYHDSAFKLTFAPTFNYYNNNDRFGATTDGQWTINDHWTVGAGGQIFSLDTPLRALNADVTANSYNVNATWHQDDTQSLRIDMNMMNFSDENLRGSEAAAYTDRLYTGQKFLLDAVANATESQDSLDEQRLYFNPKADFLGSAGLKATEVLYRDGNTVYLQSLQLLPGDYWQENYGQSFAFDARYELRAHLNDGFEAGLGGDFNHQATDGTAENSVTVLFDLTKRL